MATTYAHDGDTIIVAHTPYTLTCGDDGPKLTRVTICEACGVNDAYYDDVAEGTMRDASGARFLCPGCVSRACSAIVISDAIAHLTSNDDELRATLEVYDSVDNYGRSLHVPYVDSRASAHDGYSGQDVDSIMEQLDGMWRSICTVIAGGSYY